MDSIRILVVFSSCLRYRCIPEDLFFFFFSFTSAPNSTLNND